MRWRFWKRSDPGQTQTATVDPTPTPVPLEDSPSLSGFDYSQPPAPEPEPEPIEAVVRAKAAARRAPARLARQRGLTPLPVPRMTTTALNRRDAALDPTLPPLQAIGAWTAYLKLCPADADARFALGQAALEAGQLAAAEAAFQAVVVADDAHRFAWGALGFIAGLRKQHQAAVRCFEAAVALAPECPDMLVGLLESQAAAGLIAEAAHTRGRLEALERNR